MSEVVGGPASTEAESLFRRVLDTSPDLVWILDPRGNILRVNGALEAVLGYQSGELNGHPLLQLVHADDTAALRSEIDRVGRGGRGVDTRFDIRFRLSRSDGLWTTVAARGRAVFDDAGETVGIVAASRDVTSDVRAEQKLLLAVSNAEQASQAKSEFLSRMSHELRTPLNSVLGFAQLLEMDELTSKQEEAVAHILRAGRHLLGLIDEVLDIARIEMGHMDLVMEPVELRALVSDAIGLTSPLADRAGVSVSIAGDLLPSACVHADRQRLLQVLLNLLSNAVKYNSRGGKVRVTCEALSAGHIGVAVSDTGVGIREEDMAKLFDPFERLGAEHLGIEGTGVGLTIAKNLVERMGGVLSVFSSVGEGSTFEIVLNESVDRKEPDHSSDEESDSPPDGKSVCVLLIEDNLANLTLIENVMARRKGVRLLAAMQGTLGLDLAREHHPDLVLLDLHLPDQSGAEVLKRLRADPETAPIPVIVVSADRSSDQADAMRELGAADYLSKPFDLRDLLRSVDSALGNPD